jgi:hypothetical protein
MYVPESDLRELLQQLLSATSAKDTGVRRTTVRWFNRLYFDVRRWNETFIEFLRTYPGFHNDASAADYRRFLDTLREYVDSLHERYGYVKNDLCTNLKILSQRFTKDFAWLYEEDEDTFWYVRRVIDESYAVEDNVIERAYGVCHYILDLSANENWHLDHRKEIVGRISEYIESSKQEVANLHHMASDVGISLLSVSEYEAALAEDGSRNPQLYVLGEVTMGNRYHAEGQIGAVGPNAHVHDISFNQQWNQAKKDIDLPQLAQELSVLLPELGKKATEPEHYIAAGEVAQAEKESRANNGPKALEHLARAGKWAFQVSTDIGVQVASAALKVALGLA